MKKFQLKEDSWHFKFITWMENRDKVIYDHPYWRDDGSMYSIPEAMVDFCTYWRVVLTSILACFFGTIFLTIVAILAFFMLIAFPAAFAAAAFGGTATLAQQVLLSGYVVGYGAALLNYVRKRRLKKEGPKVRMEKEPGLIATKYRAWKEKVCPMVEFVETEDVVQ